jgi:hypothetical protein
MKNKYKTFKIPFKIECVSEIKAKSLKEAKKILNERIDDFINGSSMHMDMFDPLLNKKHNLIK